jgi:hypothetical protein
LLDRGRFAAAAAAPQEAGFRTFLQRYDDGANHLKLKILHLFSFKTPILYENNL